MLGGPTHITVGLVATFVTVVSIVAADVMAYLVGKLFGRTQLIAIRCPPHSSCVLYIIERGILHT